jgi:hypothetical protein
MLFCKMLRYSMPYYYMEVVTVKMLRHAMSVYYMEEVTIKC